MLALLKGLFRLDRLLGTQLSPILLCPAPLTDVAIVTFYLVGAFIVRIALIAFGAWQDQNCTFLLSPFPLLVLSDFSPLSRRQIHRYRL